MKNYKRFTLIIVSFVAATVLLNGLIWIFATRDILGPKATGGDLARMGYLPGYVQHRDSPEPLPLRHIEPVDYQGEAIDLLTIGDSFSNGGGGSYYQDQLASKNGFRTLNLTNALWFPGSSSRIEALVTLLNGGYFSRVNPRYLLVQSVERLVDQLGSDVDFDLPRSSAEMEKYIVEQSLKKIAGVEPKPVSFMNTGNLKYLKNKFLYLFSPNAFKSNVFKVEMDRELFTGKYGSTLLFLRDDIRTIKKIDRDVVIRINENMNRLAERLEKIGIRLYFMPTVDKYDLYSDYIRDNNFPKNSFFDNLRPLEKNYVLIDTKNILSDALARGEKDIYLADDTHWSEKATRLIAEAVTFD
jgi:hypothetical protein